MRKFARLAKRSLPQTLLVQKLPTKNRAEILLTFDDGPHPEHTPQVLDLLDEYNARAIFFIPGRRISQAPHLLSQILERGHEIGNHTYIHSNGKQPRFLDYFKDVRRCQGVIEDCCGKKPRLFRPPLGVLSLTTLLVPKLLGLQTVTWSVDIHDWRCKSSDTAKTTARKLTTNIRAGDIILLHDDNLHIKSILQILLPELSAKGFNMANGLGLI